MLTKEQVIEWAKLSYKRNEQDKPILEKAERLLKRVEKDNTNERRNMGIKQSL